MKRRNTIKIVIFTILLCCLNMAIAADEQNATPEQIKQLQSINEHIAAEQQLIENRYEQQVEALLKYTEDIAKKLDSSYRMLWIKYYDMIKDTPAKDDYLLTSNLVINKTPRLETKPGFQAYKTQELRAQMIDSYSLYKAPTFLLDENAREFVAYLANNSNYGSSVSLLRINATKMLNIMNNLQSQLSRHQQYRERALANLAELEVSLKEDVLKEASPAQEQLKGIVNATAYVGKNWLAMIDDKVVHEGDAIGDVKILKIDAKNVQFKKNSRTWTQKLGENQEALWQ